MQGPIAAGAAVNDRGGDNLPPPPRHLRTVTFTEKRKIAHEINPESTAVVDGRAGTCDPDYVVDVFLIHTGDLSPHRFQSVIVGISCLLMGVPAAWGSFYGYPYWGAMGVIMAVISFLSDYAFIAAESRAVRRRWFALDLLAIYIYVVVSIVNVLEQGLVVFTAVVIVLLVAGKCVVLEYGARAQSKRQWEFRHTIWHVFIAALCMLPHGTIVDADMQWYQLWKEPIFETPTQVVVGLCFTEAVLQLGITAVVMCRVTDNNEDVEVQAVHSFTTLAGRKLASKEGYVPPATSDASVIGQLVNQDPVSSYPVRDVVQQL